MYVVRIWVDEYVNVYAYVYMWRDGRRREGRGDRIDRRIDRKEMRIDRMEGDREWDVDGWLGVGQMDSF